MGAGHRRRTSPDDPQETNGPKACNVSLGEPEADVVAQSAGGQFIAKSGHKLFRWVLRSVLGPDRLGTGFHFRRLVGPAPKLSK